MGVIQMKKYLATAIAVTVIGTFAISAFAAKNPFTDVPLNHWTYDAINQLAAHGILSGFTDGTYRGRRLATRYEMASIVVRIMAVLDMKKASVQDAEILEKLIAEFENELYAIGVRYDKLDDDVDTLEWRLGGWRLGGSLIFDIDSWRHNPVEREVEMNLLGRLHADRWFGNNDEIRFHMRLVGDSRRYLTFDRFYVDFPAWFDTRITVGLFNWDWEAPYNFYTGGISDLGNSSFLTERRYEAFGLTKSFTLGRFQTYIQSPALYMLGFGNIRTAWEIAAMTELKFTDQFGMDLGIQYFHGDDDSILKYGPVTDPVRFQNKFDSVLTLFGGLRFDFDKDISLKGIYYHQKFSGEYSADGGNTWDSGDFDSTKAYKLAIDIDQNLLGFTSLWLGYDFMEGGFWTFNGDGFFEIGSRWPAIYFDMRTWRIGAIQRWNSKWRSWFYFAHHTFIDAADNGDNLKGSQWGLGIENRLNPTVGFALNYINSNFDDGVHSPGDNHLFRFRMQVDY
jgi:hypothetical protein